MSLEEARTIVGALDHYVHVMPARQAFVRMAGLNGVEVDFSGVTRQLLHSCFCDPRAFEFAVKDKGEPIPAKMLAEMVTAGEISRATIRMRSLVAAEMSVSSARISLRSGFNMFPYPVTASHRRSCRHTRPGWFGPTSL